MLVLGFEVAEVEDFGVKRRQVQVRSRADAMPILLLCDGHVCAFCPSRLRTPLRPNSRISLPKPYNARKTMEIASRHQTVW